MPYINLTQGKRVHVDADDYELLKRYSWCAFYTDSNRSFYAVNGKLGLMHRLVVNAPDGLVVDHINHDTLDNRKCNLRICSRQRNQHNMRMHSDNSTGFKGVSRLGSRYRARIHVNGREVALGVFDTPEQAGAAYDEAARKYFKQFAYTNERSEHGA